MQQPQQPHEIARRFLVSAIASSVQFLLIPVYFAIRSDMGVQQTGFIPIAISLAFNVTALGLLGRGREVESDVLILYLLLFILGFVRNSMQASRRRELRDWSVHSWSAGKTLLEPPLFLICRMVGRKWGRKYPGVSRFTLTLLKQNFLHYVAEPAMLLVVAVALESIGSRLAGYPAIIALLLVFVRRDMELRLYLQAHEIADAQSFEQEIMWQLEGGSSENATAHSAAAVMVRIPATSAYRPAVDERSALERLSPELQALLRQRETNQP